MVGPTAHKWYLDGMILLSYENEKMIFSGSSIAAHKSVHRLNVVLSLHWLLRRNFLLLFLILAVCSPITIIINQSVEHNTVVGFLLYSAVRTQRPTNAPPFFRRISSRKLIYFDLIWFDFLAHSGNTSRSSLALSLSFLHSFTSRQHNDSLFARAKSHISWIPTAECVCVCSVWFARLSHTSHMVAFVDYCDLARVLVDTSPFFVFQFSINWFERAGPGTKHTYSTHIACLCGRANGRTQFEAKKPYNFEHHVFVYVQRFFCHLMEVSSELANERQKKKESKLHNSM